MPFRDTLHRLKFCISGDGIEVSTEPKLHIPLNGCSLCPPHAQSPWLACLEGDMNTGMGSSVLH